MGFLSALFPCLRGQNDSRAVSAPTSGSKHDTVRRDSQKKAELDGSSSRDASVAEIEKATSKSTSGGLSLELSASSSRDSFLKQFEKEIHHHPAGIPSDPETSHNQQESKQVPPSEKDEPGSIVRQPLPGSEDTLDGKPAGIAIHRNALEPTGKVEIVADDSTANTNGTVDSVENAEEDANNQARTEGNTENVQLPGSAPSPEDTKPVEESTAIAPEIGHRKSVNRKSLIRIFSKRQSTAPKIKIPRSPKSPKSQVSPISPSSKTTASPTILEHSPISEKNAPAAPDVIVEGRQWKDTDNDSLYCY